MLPAKVPHLLVNGSAGIAVGIATKIPPHNLREVVAGLSALVANPGISTRELMQHIPAPDFPTGGCLWPAVLLGLAVVVSASRGEGAAVLLLFALVAAGCWPRLGACRLL